MAQAPQLREDGNGFASVGNATAADAAAMQVDPLSPTVIAQKFLQSQGLPLTSENMRRALTANANNPGTIPGLVNNEPPMMPSGASGAASSGGGGVGGNMPLPPTPPGENNGRPEGSSPVMGTVQNATQSSGGVDLSSLVGSAVLASLPVIASKLLGNVNPFASRPTDIPTPPTSTPQPSNAVVERPIPTFDAERMPINTTEIWDAPRALPAPGTQAQLPPSASPATITGPAPQPQLPGNGGAQLQIPQATGVERAQMRGKTFPKVPVRLRVP